MVSTNVVHTFLLSFHFTRMKCRTRTGAKKKEKNHENELKHKNNGTEYDNIYLMILRGIIVLNDRSTDCSSS